MSLFGNQLPSPEDNIYIVSAPLPNPTQARTQAAFLNPCIPFNHFPIQITTNPGPHRINRKFSFLEYFKRSLQAETNILLSNQANPEELIRTLSYELAYIGFTMFDETGSPLVPLPSTQLTLIPSLFPELQSIPLPPREMLSTAKLIATNHLTLAQKNRKNVSAHRSRQLQDGIVIPELDQYNQEAEQ